MTTFNSEFEANEYQSEIVTRSAPRWVWDFIDHLLDESPLPLAPIAIKAMQDACEAGD